MVQLLSSDCVSGFVQLVNSLYEEKEADEACSANQDGTHMDISFNHVIKYQISVLERESHMLAHEADVFLDLLAEWLRNLTAAANETAGNLDERIKMFCLDVIERAPLAFHGPKQVVVNDDDDDEKKATFRRQFALSKRKVYAAIHMSIYLLFKSQPLLNVQFDLTRFKFEHGNSRHCQYFIFRVMAHKEIDENDDFDKYKPTFNNIL